MNITIEDLRRWGACYDDDKLRALARGRKSVTPLQIARMRSVPVLDRIWVLLRPEVLGDDLRPLLESWVERAIRRVLGRSGCPEWEAWAEKWLSGEDRSDAAAKDARAAAGAAANVAWRAVKASADAWADYAANAAANAAAWCADDAAADAAADAAWHAAAWCADDAAWAAADAAWAAARCAEREQQLRDIAAVLKRREG